MPFRLLTIMNPIVLSKHARISSVTVFREEGLTLESYFRALHTILTSDSSHSSTLPALQSLFTFLRSCTLKNQQVTDQRLNQATVTTLSACLVKSQILSEILSLPLRAVQDMEVVKMSLTIVVQVINTMGQSLFEKDSMI